MSTINVSIVDQNLTITNAPTIASGDINVDVVEFEFDESWDGFGCVAVFWRDGDPAVYNSAIYPATGRAVVPHEVMAEEGRICFGVVGQKDSMKKTSCVCYYDIKQGALTTGVETQPPTPGIYEQMLAAVGDARDAFEAALVQAEQTAGRVVIYDGLASDLPTHDVVAGTFRRISLPGTMKLSDFDRVTIQLTNAGRSDLSSGTTGTLSLMTDNNINLGSITVADSGSLAFIEMAGLSGSPNSNTFRWSATSYYVSSGSPATETDASMHSWGSNGVLSNAVHLDMLLSAGSYVRVIGYCNEVAAEGDSSSSAVVVPGVHYYASMSDYNNDEANVPEGDYLFIKDSGEISLYRRTNSGKTLMCTWAKTALPSLGCGYGTCSTAAATAAKKVSIAGFTVTGGGIVSIKFTNSVPANATLAISADGGTTYPTARAIHHRGAAIKAGVIPAGAVATFVYDNIVSTPVYRLIGIDASGGGFTYCQTAEATLAKTATLSNFSLAAGAVVTVRFSFNVPASATLNISSTGAKSILFRASIITAGIIQAGDAATFVYDGTNYNLIAIDQLVDPARLGIGLANSTTGAGNVAKTATLSAYFRLVVNCIVAVKFSTAVMASATLDINSTGAKPIFFRGSAIAEGIICAGDTATFVYDGTNYVCIGVDRAFKLTVSIISGTVLTMDRSHSEILAAYNANQSVELITDIGTRIPLAAANAQGAEFDGLTYAGPGVFYLSSYFIDSYDAVSYEHVLATGGS